MAQYMLAVFHQPGVQAAGTAYEDNDAMEAAHARVTAFNDDLQQSGAMVLTGALTQPEEALVVKGRSDAAPGPIAQTTHYLGGFWIVQAADRAAAVELGQRASEACGQPIEIRSMEC